MSLYFLIGMPGAGKSYWAKEIAAAFDFELIDTDLHIERQQQKSVKAIFCEVGEEGFRQLEWQLLKEVINNKGDKDTIIAVGGGTPCFNDNMDYMMQAGTVIYLQTALDLLAVRLRNEADNRPLLAGNIQQHLKRLYNARRAVYEKAHYILPSENISLATFEKIIASCTDRQ